MMQEAKTDLWPASTREAFVAWLIVQGKASGTAVVYAGHVGQVIKALGRDPDHDHFARYLEAYGAVRRNAIRTAWRSWAAYAASKGIEVAPPPTKGKGRPQAQPGPLDALAHAIVNRGCRPRELANLRWGSVRVAVESIVISRGDGLVSWKMPKPLMRALKEIYFPGEKTHFKPGRTLFAHADGTPWSVEEIERAVARVEHGIEQGTTTAWQEPAAG